MSIIDLILIATSAFLLIAVVWLVQRLKKSATVIGSLEDRVEILLKEKEDLASHIDDLKAAENLLRTTNYTRAKIMSIISHNVKGPLKYLHYVSNFLDKNWDNLSDEELRHSSMAILDTSQSLYDLVDNVLKWSKQQNAEIQFNPERFTVTSLIDEEIKIQSPLFATKELKVKNLVDEGFELIADRHLLRLMLQNVFSNAIKFSKDGGTIRIKAKRNGDTCSVLVEDEGVGMSKGEIERIFDINDHYTRPGTNNEKGNGIGLLIIQDLVSLHGGSIAFRSRPEKGTTVELSFPLQEEPAVVA
ncbi:sensor histidine kinase [Phaeocystidibacter luteus]|uniref:histidine kinase n=1 Tax=Phaeocystidibacter luteus TaxID=911197 RepID=A0A6N6RKP2_9FLAO|nr:HAMP domain-containing sensor histidine kinase [Phaeocystidibacter luteus]KAB2813670.1 HAMP domain-containing histidine kinase [Phaeocystidibacter luteus]